MNATEHHLLATTDGREWAREFIKAVKGNPDFDVTDEELLTTWFANAIGTGRHAGIRGWK